MYRLTAYGVPFGKEIDLEEAANKVKANQFTVLGLCFERVNACETPSLQPANVI